MKTRMRSTVLLLALSIATLAFLVSTVTGQTTRCGDANADGLGPNVVDLTYIVAYLFAGGEPPVFLHWIDVDGSGGVNIADLTFFVAYLFAQGPELTCPDAVPHTTSQGSCLSDYASKDLSSETINHGCKDELTDPDPTGSMCVQMIGMDLHVYHNDAYYQCCLEYAVDFTVQGNHILAVESDTGAPCDCYCYFDLESVLYGLYTMTPTEYVVTLVGIDGDTVGIDRVTVGGPAELLVDVNGDDVYLNHLNAFYQCCLGYAVDFSVEPGLIVGQERDTGQLCDCYCFFNLQSVLHEVPEGDYAVVLIGIEGDTVGVSTTTVESVEFSTVQEIPPCVKSSPSEITWDFNLGTVVMNDMGVIYVCNAEIEVVFQNAGDTLRFFELNRQTIEPVPCECSYSIMGAAGPIQAGWYVCEVWRKPLYGFPLELANRQTLFLSD